MNLNQQLKDLRNQNRKLIPDDIYAILENATKELSDSDIVKNAAKKGDKLKDFQLTNHLGKRLRLAELREKGPVVITFYRGGWCPYCNLELRAYQESLKDIKAAGATLVAITPELPDASLTTLEKHDLKFEVLSDVNSDYAREIGLIFTLPEEIRSIYDSFGIEVEKHNGKGQFDFPLAATFIVNVDGTITSSFVDADYTLRKDPSEVVQELKSIVN